MNEVFERLASGYSLPCLSPVAMKVVEMASDEMCSVESMTRMIETEPSLAVRLLRLANSAFLAASCPVATLREAVFRIGAERLRIMALSLSLKDTFPMGRVGVIDYEAFWRESLYRALLSKSLAQHLRSCNPEEAFVAGLTLEIGLLLFVDCFIRDRGEAFPIGPQPLESALAKERERYGTDHRELGEAALRAWKFPDRIVACQRVPGDGLEEKGEAPLPRVCEAARTLSSLIWDESAELDPVFVVLEGRFALPQNTLHEMLATAFDQVQEISESLEIGVDKDRDVIDLLEKANRSLTRLIEQMSPRSESSFQRDLPSFDMLRRQQTDRRVVSQTLEAVSHEIRNPLMAVGGLVRRLSRTVDPLSAGGKYVQCILGEVARLEQAMAQMTRTTTHE